MRSAARVAEVLDRTGEPIATNEHTCGFDWCEGTIWRRNHAADTTIRTTGRDSDVIDESCVTVMVTYDEIEDSRPRILLHIGGDGGVVDHDVSPTARQARQIAMALLAGAQAPRRLPMRRG